MIRTAKMMWSEIMSELQAWRAGACIASRCTKRLCLAIGAPAIPCDTCSPIGQQIMACYRAAILTLLQSSHTSPPQLLMVRVALLLRLESGALDSLHLIWERLLYRPVGSAQRAPVAAPPDAMNSQRQVKKILLPANPPHSLPTAHYGPRGGRHSRWPSEVRRPTPSHPFENLPRSG